MPSNNDPRASSKAIIYPVGTLGHNACVLFMILFLLSLFGMLFLLFVCIILSYIGIVVATISDNKSDYVTVLQFGIELYLAIITAIALITIFLCIFHSCRGKKMPTKYLDSFLEKDLKSKSAGAPNNKKTNRNQKQQKKLPCVVKYTFIQQVDETKNIVIEKLQVKENVMRDGK